MPQRREEKRKDSHIKHSILSTPDSETCALSVPESQGSLRTGSNPDETAETRWGRRHDLDRYQDLGLSSSPSILILILILIQIQDARAISHAAASPPLPTAFELNLGMVPGLERRPGGGSPIHGANAQAHKSIHASMTVRNSSYSSKSAYSE